MFVNVAGGILGGIAWIECLINVYTPPFSVPKGIAKNLVSFIKFSKRVEVEDLSIKQGEGIPLGEKKRFVCVGVFYEFHLFSFYNYCK